MHYAPHSKKVSSGTLPSLWRLLLVLCVVAVGGCDNTIEPFSEKGAYSVYGFLGVNRDRQVIRVKPLAVPIAKVDSSPLNATVTLENLTDGSSVTLQDTTLVFEDANTKVFTHNFWTDIPVPPRTRYRLTVEGSYGTIQSTATTPTGTRPEVTPPKGGCREEITVVFREMPSLRRHRARVEVKPPDTNWVKYLQRDNAVRGYDFDVYINEQGWVAFTFLPENLVAGLPNLDLPELPPDRDPRCWTPNVCAGLKTTLMKIQYRYLGPEWYGDIPKDSLRYDPLESHDVSGGLGFFGAVLQDWVPFRVKQTPKFYCTGARGCRCTPDS